MCAGTCLYWAWGSPGRMGFWRAELPHQARRVSCQLMGGRHGRNLASRLSQPGALLLPSLPMHPIRLNTPRL